MIAKRWIIANSSGEQKISEQRQSRVRRKSRIPALYFAPVRPFVCSGGSPLRPITKAMNPSQSEFLSGFTLAGLFVLGFTVFSDFTFFRASPSEEHGWDALNKIIQSTPYPVLIGESSGKALTFNKRFADLFALDPGEDFFFLSDQRTMPLDLKDSFSRAVLGESIVLPEMWCKLYCQKAPPGYSEIYLSWAFIPVRNVSGLVDRVYIEVEDCTEHKHLEEKVRQEKSRLQAALAGARQVTCETDPLRGKIGRSSPHSGNKAFYGADDLNGLENFEELIHPDDHRTNLPNRSFFAEKVDQALKKARADLYYAFALLSFDLDHECQFFRPSNWKKAGLERKIYHVLRETNLEARCLNLEITESMAMLNMESNVRTLNRLKYMGVRLSIDDFGTGYSSLAHLQRFPLDELKIDRSFISSLNAELMTTPVPDKSGIKKRIPPESKCLISKPINLNQA